MESGLVLLVRMVTAPRLGSGPEWPPWNGSASAGVRRDPKGRWYGRWQWERTGPRWAARPASEAQVTDWFAAQAERLRKADATSAKAWKTGAEAARWSWGEPVAVGPAGQIPQPGEPDFRQ